ncbi:MAG: ABC transporter permease [Pseudomonadales bacterium]
MTALLAIIKKELLLLSRDIHGLLLLFAMPMAFILIMSLALQEQFSNTSVKKIAAQLVNQAQNAEAERVIALLQQKSVFAWQSAHDKHTAFVLTLKQQNDVLQADILVEPDTNAQTEALFTASVQEAMARQHTETLLLKLKIQQALQGDTAATLTIDEDTLQKNSVSMRYNYQADQNHARPSAVQQNVPAWLVFAMFFLLLPLSNTLISERQQATLRRLRTLPISRALPVIGKLVPYFFINQIQVLLMLAVGVYAMPWFGAESLTLGNSLLSLVVMSIALSSAALGYGILIAALARTTDQATTLGGVGNILLAALGGIMVPRFVMPETMQRIADWSPMAWGLDGFLDIFLRNGSLHDVLPEAGSLLLFGCVTIALAMHLQKSKTL